MLICMRTPGCEKLDGHDGACKKRVVTAPDVRTAAQEEAERFKHGLIAGCNGMQFDVADVKRKAFVEGAVWGAALVTPTREQIAEAIAWSADPEYGIVYDVDLAAADKVLAAMVAAATQ